MAKARIKARTKAAKRGRRKLAGPREPNGRISRSGIDHSPADVVALDARRRHLGLPKDKARDQRAGTYIGYLNILGRRDGLSDDQYEAAQEFLSLREAYLRAIMAPGRRIDSDCGTPSPEITEAYEEWARATIERYEECRRAIQEAQNETRTENLWAALDLILIRDERLPHMIGATRVLCNALARYFKRGASG